MVLVSSVDCQGRAHICIGMLPIITACKYLLLYTVTLMLFHFSSQLLSCSDSTLTVRHLLSALQGAIDWEGLGSWLDVPWSRLTVMTGKESMLKEWLQNHPAPSWKLVAWALYRNWGGRLTEHSVLKQLYGKCVTGMWLCIQRNLVGQYTTLH